MNYGPISLRSGQHNDMVADMYPSMGTGDFAGIDGTFTLTIREVGNDGYAGEWILETDQADQQSGPGHTRFRFGT
jgi:hypothetical protein